MRSKLLAYVTVALPLLMSPHSGSTQTEVVEPGLTAHEWGTFTSIAGGDGQAVRWLPLTGSTDLPGFVEHFRGASFKVGLSGTVRMETPVLYFYAAHETNVSVKVAFSKGLITEWYPHASRVEPAGPLTDVSLYQKAAEGNIAWDSVTVEPGSTADLPREERANHYYAARGTSASPLRVMTARGEQREKFLFYRGVATFPVPISVRLLPDGKLMAESRSEQEIPAMLLFERRGEKLGYRLTGALQNEATLDPLELTGTMDSLRSDVEEMLVAQGLYLDEARAMFETWRDSWFEEGSRLLYLVPRSFLDNILPLFIHPAPVKTVRVFVGRLELVTPATQREIEQALGSRDHATIERYGRFLAPILETMIQKEKNPARTAQLREYLSSLYGSQVSQDLRAQKGGQLDRNRNDP